MYLLYYDIKQLNYKKQNIINFYMKLGKITGGNYLARA